MAKQSAIEKAIQTLRDEREVLDLAIERLEAQLKAKPAKARKPLRPLASEAVAS